MGLISRRKFLTGAHSALGLSLIATVTSNLARAAQWKKMAAGVSAATPRIYIWGENASGQLGQGTVCACTTTPTPLYGLDGAISVSASYHSLVLMSDGTVKSWGANTCGQLGNNTATGTCTPGSVCGLSNIVAVAAGCQHSLAVRQDGRVLAWGNNSDGRLGDNTLTTRLTPVVVCAITNAVAVAAGEHVSYALLSDGTVRAWGFGGFGRMGDNTTNSRSTPVAVCGLSSAVAIAASGGGAAFAVLANGTVNSWGADVFGLLGRNTCDAHRSTPVAVCTITNAIGVTAGYIHAYALLATGCIRAWGGNGDARLGDNTSTDRSTPVTVCAISTAVAVGNGIDSGMALLQSGAIRTWGKNDSGYIGDQTTTSRATPVAACTLVSYGSVAREKTSRRYSIVSSGAFASSLMFIYRG